MSNGKHEAATVAATRGEATPRIEIVADRRRAHSAAFRAEVVAEAAVPGICVRDLARRHGICASLIYRWRRTVATDAAGANAVRLFPVRIAPADGRSVPVPAPAPLSAPPVARRTGSIEIELAGDVRVRVDESVGVAALRRVMLVLRGC
jgi:transposase